MAPSRTDGTGGAPAWIVALGALAAGLALGGLCLFEPATGSLEVTLVARDSGRPMGGAAVTLDGPSYFQTKSDACGKLAVSGLRVGMYKVRAETPGHVVPEVGPWGWVRVEEGRKQRAVIEMMRRPSWVGLVLHYDIFYPGELISIAVRGLTLRPFYQLDVYRVVGWREVSEWEARQHAKALKKAVSLGEVSLVSSEEKRPGQIDQEGVFYDRVNLGQLPVGRYLIVAGGENASRGAEALTVSRLGVLVKSDGEQAVVWVSDLMSGKPIAGADVRIAGRSGITDADGLVRLSVAGLPEEPPPYQVRAGEDVVSVSAYRWQTRPKPYRLYWFTDRPIYRPGDKVLFKGVVRKQIGTAYSVPKPMPVTAKVIGPDGTEIFATELTTNDNGSFAGSFTIPARGRTGLYVVTSAIGGFTVSSYVSVASYLKPELQLSARPLKPQYVRGDVADVDIEARYYFGAPAAEVGVHWALTREIYYAPWGWGGDSEEYLDYYAEYEGEPDFYGGELIAEGDGKTDANGRLRLALPSQSPTARAEESPYHDYVFRLNVWTTSDVGGAAETSTSYLVTRGSFSLIVSPDRYVLTPGQAAQVKVEARDFQGKPVANERVSVSLVSERVPGPGRRVQRKVVATAAVTTGADGMASTSVTAPEAGDFVLEASARDARRREIAVRQHVWAASGFGEWRFGEGQADITIIPDRATYREGDRARLLVTSQREGPALFTVEGARLYEVRLMQLRRGANLIEVSVNPEYVPNMFVWVGQVYGKGLHAASKEINISREARRLKVKVQPGAKAYRPGKKATCRVSVTDEAGKPARAELAIGVVDEAIYALARDRVEDPADFFYYRRWNSVATTFAPESQYVGGGDKAPSSVEVRRRFVDTAFWAPQVLTDEKGVAEVSFNLPDNLTSWRVTARAVSADTKGGQATANFEVNKPLMVRLDLPRFAVQGDRFRVSAYVHNETDRERRVAVDSWARGVDLRAPREEVVVRPHGVVRRDWWATAAAAAPATIGASAVAGELQDAVELTLPVSPLTRTQFDAWSGQTEARADITFSIREDSAIERSRLTISVWPSVAASLFSSLDYLLQYPYGCTEQVVSSFLPDLHVLRLLEARGLADAETKRRIGGMVRDGLARLSSLKREEGGWGWGRWGDLDIWMTAYALMALQEARRSGYQTMDPSVAESALQNAVQWHRPDEYPDDLAFAAYVLARQRSDAAAPLIARALGHKKLSGRGRALCVLGLFELGATMDAQRLMEEVWRTAKPEGKYLYWSGLQDVECRWWDGGANVEATAWSLKAALRANRKDPRIAAIAGWLLNSRHGDRWVSTRDTAIALDALVDYLSGVQEPNPNYTAVVALNGTEVLRRQYTRDLKTWGEASADVPASLLRRGANGLTFSRGEGQGRLYYLVSLRQQVGIRRGEKTAAGDIVRVEREYRKLARGASHGGLAYGSAGRASDTFEANDRVVVRLIIHSSQRLRYALIEDYFPAGMEPDARGDVGFMDWRSWWVDNDVRDDRVAFYLDWLPAGDRTIEYVLTARTPGRFSALPPTGFAMYQPDINAVGELAKVQVRE